jgi:hypothetical protein
MVLPVGRQYTSKLQGGLWRTVRCANCGLEFAYYLGIEASGVGSSFLFLNNEGARESAHEDAERMFLRKADTAIGLVRCPDCHLHQPDMVQAVQHSLKAAIWGALALTVTLGIPLLGNFGARGEELWLLVLLFGFAIIYRIFKDEIWPPSYGMSAWQIWGLGIVMLFFVMIGLALAIGEVNAPIVALLLGLAFLLFTVVRFVVVGSKIVRVDSREKPKHVIFRRSEMEAEAERIWTERKVRVKLPEWS